MISCLNLYYIERIEYIKSHINNSRAGKRFSYYKDDKLIFYAEKSTFPWYIKFAYLKKPKSWFLLSDKEKSKEQRYFQYNTKDINSILRKLLKGGKLTDIQKEFVDILFVSFEQYYKDCLEEGIDIFYIDMKECPF